MTGQETRGVKLVQDSCRSRINLWSHWQGCLEAKILVIGQDWGEKPDETSNTFWTNDPTYPSLTGVHPQILKHKFKTDNNLADICREALGLDLKEKQESLFFTNAVLCYRDKGFTGAVNPDWFRSCQPYCARLIEIIKPKAIVTLGSMPLRALLYRGRLSYDKNFADPDKKLKISKSMREIVAATDQLYYRPEESINIYPVVPMYHCGSWGTKARSRDKHVTDWARLGNYINI
jgi:DNA polymerase